MMTNIIAVTIGVALGTLLATGTMFAVLCNKRVLKGYVKWVTKMTNEITDELYYD